MSNAETELVTMSKEQVQIKEGRMAMGTAEEFPASGAGTVICTALLTFISVILIIFTFPFSMLSVIKVIPQYERAIIYRLGRIKGGKTVGPGTVFIIPCIDKFIKIDIRLKTFDVPPQTILSRDSVTVHVDAIVNYYIFDPILAVNKVLNANTATQLLAQTTLRNILGSHKLAEILELRDQIQTMLQRQLDEATDQWGVKVEKVLIKDVRIPRELQRSMAAEAEATREAKAKVIAAEGELNASRALKEAAETISQSSTALQLRYLQTLGIIAAEKSSTIIFPIPIDMMGPMMPQCGGGGGAGGGGAGIFPPSVQTVAEADRTKSFI